MRAFVSVDVPRPTIPELIATAAAPSHLTLAFLGEVADARAGDLEAAVGRGVAGPAFTISFRGIDAFPTARSPRVVFVGVRDGREALEALAGRVRSALTTEGFPFDPKPFVPHLTLFRVRGPRDEERARRLLDRFTDADLGSAPIASVELKSSELRRTGAAHHVLASYPLAPAPP